MIWLVIAAFALLAVLELPALVRAGHKRTLAVFGVCYALTLAYAVMVALGAQPPTPAGILFHFYKNVLGLTYVPF